MTAAAIDVRVVLLWLCLGTRRTWEKVIRFVFSRPGEGTPDLAKRLSGHGFWVRAVRDLVIEARQCHLFDQAVHCRVIVSEDLEKRLALSIRCQVWCGGQGVAGFEKMHAHVMANTRYGPYQAARFCGLLTRKEKLEII